MTTFSDLGLSPSVLKAVKQLGYKEPTPVQAQAIPLLLEGRDVIAGAQTGTGKTAAFALPCMDKLGRAGKGAGPIMLVITPTRELANQIGEVCNAVAKHTRHKVLTVVGGVSYKPQVEGLRCGCDILIATPGRLEDLISQDACDLSLVTTLVIDEADRMLDMGFLPAVERIIKRTNSARQTLLFSATIDKEVQRFSKKALRSPARVDIAHNGDTADTVDQFIVRISHAAKSSLLAAVLRQYGGDRVIVFARTRHRADSCARRIKKAGFKVDVIHSDRSQNQRKRALDAFAGGKVGVLVATDVLARGIDVSDVSYVVNYDMPTQPEDYVHRIGRTGRAGQRGMAISFVSPETEQELKDVEKFTKQTIEEITIEDFDREAAEAEAADRVIQNKIRREKDPEVAKVLQETASKEKAKRKKKKSSRPAKAKAANGSKTPVPTNSEKGPKAGKRSTASKGPKAPKGDKTAKAAKGAKAKRRTSKKEAASQPKARRSKNDARAFGDSLKRDFAPGRAHRAEVRKEHGLS